MKLRFYPSPFTTQLHRCHVSPTIHSDKIQPRHLHVSATSSSPVQNHSLKRRHVIAAPLISAGATLLFSAVSKAEEPTSPETTPPPPQSDVANKDADVAKMEADVANKKEGDVEVMNWRIYDASVIGEPMAIGKENRKKVWEKLMNARVVYLGEAEQVPIGDDKELELEIVKKLHKRCVQFERSLCLALEAFSCNLQEQLNQFINGSINGEVLKMFVSHWAPERWQEYEPLLNYCRDNGVHLVACGIPLEVLRTIQSEGIRGLPKADRKKYAPPAGSGFISGFTAISRRSTFDMSYVTQSPPFEPSSYLSTQARAAEDYTMSQVILEAVADDGASGLLVVVTGASHVTYGPRGTGVPARISRKMQKKNQAVILLNPERQQIRREGETPVADLLWYSAARQCTRNCYDRAEIARVMNAAGRKRDALPQDLQKGLDLGLISPEVLQNFFDLEKYPLISELTHRFQGFRERLLADPKFLQKLAIEEAISITTTLLAQYEKRKDNFFEELDYVITDTARGAVVDFFTVWLPAPTLSFLMFDEINSSDSVEVFKGLLGSIPDNAFQRNLVGRDWNLSHRVLAVFVGGLKLAAVGFISSIGAVASSNGLYAARRFLNPSLVSKQQTKRSPILKTAVVYGGFLGISANLRYQFIAGIVEHRISELVSDQALFVNMLSFVTRTINSYWGTQQWIDLARFMGLQSTKSESVSPTTTENSSHALECTEVKETSIDEINQ
ncbi:hypothetical protein LIER_30696 [Lithospermum erythrorhizon]|uniref:Haem-binding uptake Tiki superfamily ChaN domain-containing protein n=1 Tax=Lithospermum erythrorhizon TaxID=34254 RepID=A0AAV3RRW2_LITER